MKRRQHGIYEIRHRRSGRRYIGSAVDVPQRLYSHRHALERGAHGNTHLQSAWNTYGADAFVWGILEVCARRELVRREQAWIDRIGMARLYNIAPVAGSAMLGRHHSEETRLRMSRSQTGRPGRPSQVARAAVMSQTPQRRRANSRKGARALWDGMTAKEKAEFVERRAAAWHSKNAPNRHQEISLLGGAARHALPAARKKQIHRKIARAARARWSKYTQAEREQIGRNMSHGKRAARAQQGGTR